MRIESSQLEMAALHVQERADRVTEELTVQPAAPPRTDSVQLSSCAADLGQSEVLDPKVELIRLVAEMLLGRKVRLTRAGAGAGRAAPSPAPSGPPAAAAPAAPSITYRRTEVHHESEQTSFAAQGIVQTADGRTITFSASLSMSREFTSESSFTLTNGVNTTDPLVVNLNGAPARVTGAKIDFDLDRDGKTEKISFVSDGSGFLALDRNGDGKVNDGGELFGPASGSGFAELAAYDSDGNGWIDESDPVFAQLRIWTKDAAGGDTLSTLADQGVGAIATASVSTEFSLKDENNVLDAQVRRSGVYLSENGGAGTVQQLDLVAG